MRFGLCTHAYKFYRCEKVSTPERPALLITIDSDAICIAMCNNAPVTIELSRIWQDKFGQQYYSSSAARKARAGASLVELIDIEMLGSDRTDTLMRVAMVLMAGKFFFLVDCITKLTCYIGGCDYSKGILSCGLLKDTVMDVARGPPASKLWLWRAGPAIHVDVGSLLTWIGSIKKRKTRKGTTVESFCLELHRILWTVRTFAVSASVWVNLLVGCVLVRMWPD